MTTIGAALKMPDYKNPEALAALDALGPESAPELTTMLETLLAQVLDDQAKADSGGPARERLKTLARVVVGLGRHLARAGEPFPERLDDALGVLSWTFVEHLKSPDAVAEAMKSVPRARLEPVLLATRRDRPPISFWQLLPSCPTPAVIARGIGIVLGWEKGKLSSSRAPGIATAALIAAGAPAAPLLSDAILTMKKEPYRDALVSALAGLPEGGTEALIHALGDSSKAVVSAARHGLLDRKPSCIPAVDAAMAKAKKKALKTRLLELRAELGPVYVETGQGTPTTPLEEARARVPSADVDAVVAATRPPTVNTMREVTAALDALAQKPEALALGLLDAARAKAAGEGPFASDPIYELCTRLRTLADVPVTPWAAAASLTSRKKGPGGKANARAQLEMAVEALGDALRAPLTASLRLQNNEVAYPEVYWEWLADAPVTETIPLFLEGLASSKVVSELAQSGLVRLGADGAEAAASALDHPKKSARAAAAEVLVQVLVKVPTPGVTDAIRARLAKEKDAAIKARLDAALGAAMTDLI